MSPLVLEAVSVHKSGSSDMYDFGFFGDIAVCISLHKARSAKLLQLNNSSSPTLTSEDFVSDFELAVSLGCFDF